MCAVIVDVVKKWAQHMTTDDDDDNVANWGSWAIYLLVTRNTRAPWLAAGAEGVLRGIIADTSGASADAKNEASGVLKKLGLQA